MKKVTMKDIAKQLDVSIVTVSKALSEKEGVSLDLREKIKAVANELGYQSGAPIKTVKETNKYNIGIIVAERFVREDVSYYLKVYQKMVKELLSLGYYGLLEIVTKSKEEECIEPNILTDRKVSGIILLGELQEQYIHYIKQSELPVLLVDYTAPKEEADAVVTDNFYGSYILTEYLIENRHKRIGFVGTISWINANLDRYMGYTRALLKHNIALEQQWLICDREEGEILSEFVLPESMPTAFVCCSDEVAYAFSNYLKSKGYRIPEDISIVAYDNYIYAELNAPKLTTYSVNIDTMTEVAAKALIQKIESKEYQIGRKIIEGKIITRDSVRPIIE